jgi:hypothetical protein
MSLFGAVRMYLHAGQTPQERRESDELPSIPAGRWAAWARTEESDHSLTDYPCRLPDGSLGRVAVVELNGDWTLVCRVA